MERRKTISLSTKNTLQSIQVKRILRIMQAQQIQEFVCLHLSNVLQFYFPFFIFPFLTLSTLFLSKAIWNHFHFEMGFYKSNL